MLPYMSILDIGTMFVYLKQKTMGKWKRVCFWKGPIKDYMDPNPKQKWIDLEPDLAIGKVKEHYKAGIVGIKFSIHDVTKDGPIDWAD